MNINSQNVFSTFARNGVRDMAKSEAHRAFLEIFYMEAFRSRAVALPVVDLSDSDNNGTGYLDGLVKRALGHPAGTILRAWTGDTNNRRVLILVTALGNVVFFERYTGGDRGIVVSNAPDALRHFVPSGAATADNIAMVFGQLGGMNLVEALDFTFAAAQGEE